MSRETNARWCAFATISFMCALGHKLLLTSTPKSHASGTTGSRQLSRGKCRAGTCFPVLKTLHFSVELASCHSIAHSTRDVKTSCKCAMLTLLIIFRYIFTSPANILTLIWCRSSKQISSFMYTRNIGGPMPLPCTTPLHLSLIHIWRCRRSTLCRSRWSPYH